ncbi:STAS domain-containing protein [Mycobacterium celatum]|uniref:Anti-sigma factor antagonist n=2 Tax=Mycobacterium celatum TaxID=28045 RepID=A0A1X1RWR4_MYCCE|nr:STAS domain-containing protein [Mycobacterium celatum]ORV19590.1 anti-anti-sigma factor [Mycobacterium celatum]PIB79901.1 anti-sigma factor antagonist [Mycobacterium celatum]
MELLAVDCEVVPEAVVVHVKGEVDSSTVGGLISDLGAALRQAETHVAKLLVIDLQSLTYFGSAGLNAVLDCHRQGAEAGTSVRLVADNDLVIRPIEVTNLDSVLQIFPTLTDALQDRHPQQT